MALSPAKLSYELRKGRTPDLRRRRWITGLSFVGSAAGMIVSLYQMGVFRRLPDLPLRLFDATKVDASDYAYKRLQMPDGPLMVASYAVTAALASAGGKDRVRDNPALPIALAAKTLYDVVVALKLAQEEWRENQALCGYCQAATVASLISAGIALPEAVRAVQHVMASEGANGARRDRSRPPERGAQVEAQETSRRPKTYMRPLRGQQPVHARA